MVLWNYLRVRPMGYKFRRQHPIGSFIADFYCHALKLVIEANGSIHDLKEIQKTDVERQISLEKDGLHILRFTNTEIVNNPERVLQRISDTLIKRSMHLSNQISIPSTGG